MENYLESIDELIEDSGDKLMDSNSSEDRLNESNVYLNLCRARNELNKPVEAKESKLDKAIDIGGKIAIPAAAVITALAKFYEVWARRRTNQEGMFMEEKAGKFVPPKWFHNN